MNTKNIAILAIITLVLVFIAAQFSDTSNKTEETQAGSAFFPDLLSELKNIDSIRIQTASENFTVNKVDGVWGLASNHNYPVAMDNVSKILNGMASFILLEKKTAKPKLYERLDLQDVSLEASKATLIELKKGHATVASLLLGKNQTAKSDRTRTEVYVRKPNEEQTWLVMGTLSFFSKTPNEWLDKTISDIDGKRIREVSIEQKDAEPVKIFKTKETDNDYQLADLPPDAELSEAYKLNNLARSLDGLNLDDVLPASEVEFDESAAQIVFNTFDGLVITAKAMKKDAHYYLHLAASAKPETAMPIVAEEKPAESEQPKPELKETAAQRDARVAKEAEEFNQKVTHWVYLIPEYKYNNLLPKKSDLFSIKEVVEETPAEEPLENVEEKATTDSTATESTANTAESAALPTEEMLGTVAKKLPEAEATKPVEAVPETTQAAEIDVKPATEEVKPEEVSANVEDKADAVVRQEQAKADFVKMLKEAAERAKQNPQPQNALAQPVTVQNLQGKPIDLAELFRKAAERAKQQAQAEQKAQEQDTSNSSVD